MVIPMSDRHNSWRSMKEIFTQEILGVECPMCGALKGDGCSNVDSGDFVSPHPERLEVALKFRADKMPVRGVYAGMERRKQA